MRLPGSCCFVLKMKLRCGFTELSEQSQTVAHTCSPTGPCTLLNPVLVSLLFKVWIQLLTALMEFGSGLLAAVMP